MRSGLLLVLVLSVVSRVASFAAEPPFQQRGYYITFMRMPTYGLSEWKRTVDLLASDGANTLILWMGGGFPSRKFPITWKYNLEHQNVRHNFLGQLIDHAHTRGVKVLLGFTPFGYDGVNQYSIQYPELKARKPDGQPADMFGIHSWGWNLCPSKPESQRFMLEYAREMLFDFYPKADGVMMESSDYAICHCRDCSGKFFEREFAFVREFSEEIWAKHPQATVVVYPHYFSGAKVPGFGVSGARFQFDPRWTLFFTPHSAHPDPDLIKQARASLWWDDAPPLRGPGDIQHGARKAQSLGVSGYVPSLEAFSYVASHIEEGQQYVVGRRQVPLGFGWLKPEQMPFNELPIRVNRIAYREFSRQPDLDFDSFKKHLGRELFGDDFSPAQVEDALQLQSAFMLERSWSQASPLADPERVRARKSSGQLSAEAAAGYRTWLDQIRTLADRNRGSRHSGVAEMVRIADWLLGQWTGDNAALLVPK